MPLVLAAVVGLSGPALGGDATGPSPPAPPASVLLITLDTTRADRLGCYGHEAARTPNLDALAARGVRFEQAVSPAPLTVPSHASILTGLVPRRHGARDNGTFLLPPGAPTLAELLRDSGRSTAAVVGSFVLDRRAGLDRGFDRYDDDVRVGARTEFAYEERSARDVTDAALAALDDLAPPFFLWAHYFDPHAPYVPPPPWEGYDGEIAFVDAEIGRLLEAAGRRSHRLLVVAVADHGESLGEHGEDTHGLFVYQATQHVPFLLAGPGVPRGRTVGARVGLVDVMPTVLDLLGLRAPERLDGRSLAPFDDDASTAPARYELETLFPWLSYGWSPLHGMIADGLKVVEAPRPEVYDLATDPDETTNRIDDPPPGTRALRSALAHAMARDTVERAAATGPEAAERRRRLESLGYVAGGPPSAGDGPAIDPKDGVRLLADLARARELASDGRPDDCVDALRPLLAANPDNVPGLLTLASCRLAAGDAAGALAAADVAERIRPGDDLVAFHRANALAARAEAGEVPASDARAAFDVAVRRNPRRADAWLNYAGFVARTEGPEAALDVLGRADAAGVLGPDLEVTRALQWLRLGRGDEGEAAFARALARNPGDPQVLEALARLRLRAGDPAGASGYLARLLDVAPRWDVARELGLARRATGDESGARAAWRRALALLPEGHPARAEIRSLSEGDPAPDR